MKIAPFATEHYYAKYEFTTPHLLSVSDCETVSIGELMELANVDTKDLLNLRLGYTDSQGNPELREAVTALYQTVSSEQVVILGSPVEGIYLTMRSLLEPGDRAIVLTPAYDALINVAEHITADIRRWELRPTERGWSLDLNRLEGLLSSETKLVIVNFPHNPTGFLPGSSEFAAFIELIRKSGSWLYCDEIYRELEYNRAHQLPSAADVYERAVVLSGLSKSYGLPGLRAGWLAVPDAAAREKIINWKHYTSICPPAPSEKLAQIALSLGDALPKRSRQIIRGNLQAAENFFAKWRTLFTWRPPQAGSVALTGINVPSARAYCYGLAEEAGVLLLPGIFMGSDDQTVRFGFGRKSFIGALEHYDHYLNQKKAAFQR